MIYLTMLLCFFTSILITPVVKKLAFKIGATDKPNYRKVHQKIMPRLGGLAVFISFLVGIVILQPVGEDHLWIVLGSAVIILTGMFDDMYEISARVKLLGQLVAAGFVVILGEVHVTFINIPFFGQLDFGMLSIPITVLWIVGVTNAINLIDGLDGLASGVSSIALITIAGMAFIMGNTYVVVMASVMLAATLGFLYHNFHPAKIFLGDTGALFLGYMIAVLSLLGFKNVTMISLIIPIIILGVPISDTFFAIARRILHKKPLSAPDKSHLHHCLLGLGFTHRQTVLLIYAMAAFFGLVAVIFSQATVWGAIVVITVLLFIIELLAEAVGLMGKDHRPLIKFLSRYAIVRSK